MTNEQLFREMIQSACLEIQKPEIRSKLDSLKVGDTIKIGKDIPWISVSAGDIGTITDIEPVSDENPIQEHGIIEIKFSNGEVEHFVLWKWWEHMERIE